VDRELEGRLIPTGQTLSDDALDGFLRNPGEDTFAAVYSSLYAPLCRYFIVRGLDFSTAEELSQDVLLTVYLHSNEVRNQLCITGWIYRIARNRLLQHARKNRLVERTTRAGRDESLFPQAAPPVQLVEESALFEWIQTLEEDEREICLMRYMDALEYQYIADALQIPIGTVKWKLHQIKKKVAVRLGMGNKK
jgi:RNA polymerase sigma-70 factor (ECF subfamily)